MIKRIIEQHKEILNNDLFAHDSYDNCLKHILGHMWRCVNFVIKRNVTIGITTFNFNQKKTEIRKKRLIILVKRKANLYLIKTFLL